jgi:hypothetical protein
MFTNHDLHFGTFQTPAAREVARDKWRLSYERLVEKLGSLGSEVLFEQIIEDQPDPHVIRGRHEIIWPPQRPPHRQLTDRIDEERAFGNSVGTTNIRRYKYRPDLVVGHLLIEYSDGADIIFSISDVDEKADIPQPAQTVIKQTLSSLSRTAST